MRNYSPQITSFYFGEIKPLPLYTIVVVIVMSMASVSKAQLPARTITTDAEDAQQVYAVDLNGDSYPDILSASAGDNKVAWYKNKIGQGGDDDGFGRQQIITTDAAAAQSIHAGDLNGNGRPDILSASSGDNKIAWYENQTGEGDGFSDQKLISTDAEGATSVYMEDLTGDGNADILSASADDNTIAWYENQIEEGKGFSDQRVITTDAQGATSVTTEDLNGDGNPDVISASAGDNKIAWYRNQVRQDGGFSDQEVITTNADDVQSVDTAPLGHLYPDSAPDVVFAATEKVGKCVNPLQNNDYESWSCRPLSTDGRSFQAVYASDIMESSGIEVLHTSSGNGNVGYGDLPNIAKEVNNPTSVYTSDIDRDGDRDVICASNGDNMITWFESNFDGPNGAWVYNLNISFDKQNTEINWRAGRQWQECKLS